MPRRPAPEDAPQPPAAQEAARLLVRLVPVAVPLLLFVLIVAKGIQPALEERARRLEDLEAVERRYELALEARDEAEANRAELDDPVGRERRRRIRDEGGTPPTGTPQRGR